MLLQPLQCRFHYFRCFHLDFKDGVYIYGLFMEGKDLLFVGAFGFGPNSQCNQASLVPGARWDSTSHLVPYRNCCLYDYHMINFDSLVSLVSYLLVVFFVMIVAVFYGFWCYESQHSFVQVQESQPKVLFTDLPPLWFLPVKEIRGSTKTTNRTHS